MEERPFSDISYELFLNEEKLMGSHCKACGTHYVPPRSICINCYRSDMKWVEMQGKGKLAAFFGGLVDKRMRKIFLNILKASLVNPLNFFQSAYIQSFMIIQPVNFETDGRQDMCDSCPDITVHDGKLVWSCRMEELNNFGAFVQTVPKSN